MSQNTSTPLPATPVTPSILRRHNDRLGAVYLSLYGFWHSRQTALSAPGSRNQAPSRVVPARRDSYSVILFDHTVTRCFENDFRSTPENLLQALLHYEANGGTDYDMAIKETEAVMRANWSTERYALSQLPFSKLMLTLVKISCCHLPFRWRMWHFGYNDAYAVSCCYIARVSMYSFAHFPLIHERIDFSRKPLSFHAVSFGPSNQCLRRMAQIAREVELTAPRDPLLPANSHVESSYAEALDSVGLNLVGLGSMLTFIAGPPGGNIPRNRRLPQTDTGCPHGLGATISSHWPSRPEILGARH